MSENTARAFIHCHSDHSLKDSPLKIKDLVNRAKEMGATAVTLTDHGTATGLIEFMNTCGSMGIKGIPGVEAYVDGEFVNRSHLVLLAKNYEGFQELSRAISESNANLQNNGGIMVPVMNKDIIKRNFGNGNVIATTACVSGVIATILLGTEETVKKINSLKKTQSKKNNPNSKEYTDIVDEFNSLASQVEELTAKKNILDALSKKAYAKRQSGLKALAKAISSEEDKLKFEEASILLEKEMEESKKAKEDLPEIKSNLAKLKKKLTLVSQTKKKLEESHIDYLNLQTEIERYEATIPSDDELLKKAEAEALWYKDVFRDDFYIELQYHGLESEQKVMPIMADISRKFNIPVVATNDVHIATKSQAEARAFMKALRFEKWEEPDETEKELYMKSDKELYSSLIQIIPKDIANEAMINIMTICDKCEVIFPNIDHYPKYKDENGNELEDAGEALRRLCYDNIPRCYPDGFTDYERLERELETIISLGYADYTLIVADYINYAKEYGVNNHPAHVAMSVGPGRGSGAGSVVNFLVGITNLDPLKYDLKFERYLNKDRVSMPDIDTDFSEEVREEAIAYVTRKYGADTVAAIRTCMTQGAKGSIQNSARIRGYEKFPMTPNETKDSIKNKRKPLQSLGETIKKDVPAQVGTTLKDCIDDLRTKHTNDDAKVIINRAEMVEGTATSLSVHAAGIIIGDGTPLKNYVPLLYNTEKKCMAVQCDMVEAEQLHLLKMDFLGLINLDIITECARRVKANTGITLDLNNLPFEDEVFKEIFSKGNTSCVFQFESGGMKQMLREFKPESFEDIILLVAAYRPGPMDFIPEIIKVKNKVSFPNYIVPQLKPILSKTYGQPIYQEQLMDIFHVCAGFSLGEADIIRRYMSKKKVDKFLAYKPQFVNGIITAGATEKDANALWDSLEGFAKYAFNKSHAAAYALVSYITAYLKHHYPVEFMCSTLNHTKDTKKIPGVLYECKRMGIKVCTPDINKSLQGFEDRNGMILYGLGAISGIKKEALTIIEERNSNGPFMSLKEFLLRTPKMTKNVEKMIECGVFDALNLGSRKAMIKVLSSYSDVLDKINKKQKQIAEITKNIEETADSKEKAKLEKSLDNAMRALEAQKAQFNAIEISENIFDDKSSMLKKEYELMGAYISGHPLDVYKNLFKDKNTNLINDACEGFGTYAGMVSNIRFANRKVDNAKMAFFTLEDITGTIEVSCFTDAFAKYGNLIEEGNVLRIYGKIIEEEGFREGDEVEKKLIVKDVFTCKAEKAPLLVSIPTFKFHAQALEELRDFVVDEGHPIYWHDRTTGAIVREEVYLRANAVTLESENIKIIKLKKL